jgi:hypothetical protein
MTEGLEFGFREVKNFLFSMSCKTVLGLALPPFQ